MEIVAILLAAGNSTRMGKQNKLLLPFKGKSLLSQSLDQLDASELEKVIVVTGFEASKITKIASPYPFSIAYNPDYKQGMTSSIKKGIAQTPKSTDGFMICLCDMPFLSSLDYNQLCKIFVLNRDKPNRIIVPTQNGQRGNPVIFSAAYRQKLLEHSSGNGCKEILQQNLSELISVELKTPNVFVDIDSPQTYKRFYEGD